MIVRTLAPLSFTALVVAALLLGGCASTPATRFYVIVPTLEASAPTAATPPAVVIRDVRLPPYLDRQQIVTRGSEHRLQVADHDKWASDLRQDLMRVLAENLGRLLASDRVIAAPHRLRQPPDYRVDVEISRFERGADDRVTLVARWSLTRGNDGAVLAERTASHNATVGDGASYEALVAAMSRAYGELARPIAEAIQAQGAGKR
jgi:uncharacterized lipoprotein YmbA